MPFSRASQGEEGSGALEEKAHSLHTDPARYVADLLHNYAGARSQVTPKELLSVIEDVLLKGEPLDDKKGTTEVLIAILTGLDSGSSHRTLLTNKLIDKLWSNLQHPPLSYVGGDVEYDVINPDEISQEGSLKRTRHVIEFGSPDGGGHVKLRQRAPDNVHQYRSPDGSFNSVLSPDLGKAGMPYARSVRPGKALHGVKPDPGLLFDLLMARDDGAFTENPAGISSMLFYHATIIIHDIFRTSRTDSSISDTSSYLDLAPLYGSCLEDQLAIRTMKEGKLKPDTFHEKRMLGQPPGVNVMLVLYSRFHNYVADMLLKINENERFSLTCQQDASAEVKARARAKQDHDLFNTARLVVGGLYINISLHDYLRAITNTHASNSDWTLDPRVEMDKHFGSDGTPRGIGNQVSVEFNLLYRFHSCISRKDDSWLVNFFLKLLPNRHRGDLHNVGLAELRQAIATYEQGIPKDPSVRTFDGLERQADGTFKDEDLVRILKEAMSDPAGSFGARTIPKALRVVEIMGIVQARKWQVASLNEFRDFFGLKRHATFRDINSNAEIANLLEKLYTDPDMVELYPGLLIEDTKPVRSPGCGICPTYSVGRAVLSDAITLVRSDRFNTIDYNVATLTSWGFNEVRQDYKTLGGSMLYKLIQRGVPNWFPFNSVAVMQPMYTKKANEDIARKLGTLALYSLDDPKPPPHYVIFTSSGPIKQILDNPQQFAVPWLQPIQSLSASGKDYGWFMLAADEPRNRAHRASFLGAMAKVPNLQDIMGRFIDRVGRNLLTKEALKLADGLYQLDLIRDVAIPLNTRLLADLFCLDMLTDENPNGSLAPDDMYRHLINIRIWDVNNYDIAQAWNRRRRAQEAASILYSTTVKQVREIDGQRRSPLHDVAQAAGHLLKADKQDTSLRSHGRKLVQELLAQGNSVDRVADTLWLTAFAGIGNPSTTFCEILQYFLRPDNASLWTQVQTLARQGDDKTLQAHVLEAYRLVSTQRNIRVATAATQVDGQAIQQGDLILLLLGEAGRNPKDVPAATEFDSRRTMEGVTSFSRGQHQCVGEAIVKSYITGLMKLVANLEGLRAAPGQMGVVKTVQVGREKAFMSETWSYLSSDACTWKVHFNESLKGN